MLRVAFVLRSTDVLPALTDLCRGGVEKTRGENRSTYPILHSQTCLVLASLRRSYLEIGSGQELVSERSERGVISFRWFRAVSFRVPQLSADVLLFQQSCKRCFVISFERPCSFDVFPLRDPTLLFMSRPRRRGGSVWC